MQRGVWIKLTKSVLELKHRLGFMHTIFCEEYFQRIVDNPTANCIVLAEFEGNTQTLFVVAHNTIRCETYTPPARSRWPLHATVFAAKAYRNVSTSIIDNTSSWSCLQFAPRSSQHTVLRAAVSWYVQSD